MDVPLSSQSILGKRKKLDDGDDLYVDEDFSDGEEQDLDNDDGDAEDIKTDDGDADEGDLDDCDEGMAASADQYHEGMEEFPKFAAYDRGLPKITTGLTNLVQQVLNIIEANPCNSGHVQYFQQSGQKLLEIPKPKAIKIALLGDTGAGKSSLLNSIIDIPDLARALGSGESCTCVATEYCAAFPQQQIKFAAEVQYFDLENVRTILKEHVDSYMAWNFFPKEELGDEDQRMLQKLRADTAFKTFRALFCKKKEFKSEDNAMKTLNKLEKLDSQPLADQMFEWAKELLETVSGGDGNAGRYREADTKVDFRKVVDPLLSPGSIGEEPALWPLVKFVRIGVKGSRVLDNVTIADLPGISDTNQVKVNACLDHIRSCDALWVVAPILRAVNSATIYNVFGRYEERFRGKIAIICTRSDDEVSRPLAAEMEARHQSIADYKKYAKKAKRYRGAISETKTLIRRRLQALDTAMRKQKVKVLRTKLYALEDQKLVADNKKWCALVKTRNTFVTAGLAKEMQGHLPEGQDLKVFCVSNEHYLTLKTGEEDGSFQLGAEETGIPALREYALSLAAPGTLQAIEDYIKHHFTVFLKGVNLWVISQYVEGAAELLKIVQEPQDGLSDTLTAYREELATNTRDSLESKLLSRAKKHGAEAREKHRKRVQDNHWATVKAFMRKDGKHKTAMCAKESWNEQFYTSASNFISKEWGGVNKAQVQLVTTVEKELMEEVKGMLKSLKAQSAVEKLDLESFEAMLAGQLVGIENAFRDHQKNYAQEMKNIKIDATQDRHTGFFTRAMQVAYDKCKADSGTGTMERSNGYLFDHLSKQEEKSPFAIAAELLAGAIANNAAERIDELTATVESILRDTYNHFDGMIDDELTDHTEDAVRLALKEYLKKAELEFKELQEGLQKIKDKYEPKVVQEVIEISDAEEAKKAPKAKKIKKEA